MSQLHKHLDAIHRHEEVDVPGSTWREASQLVPMIAMVVFLVATMVMGKPGPWKLLLLGLATLLPLAGVVYCSWLLLTLRRAIRITRHGLSTRNDRVIGWEMLAGATHGEEASGYEGTTRKRVLALPTPEGRAWARAQGIPLIQVVKPERALGFPMPEARGCSRQETAELLTVAIRLHRQHLGLPPDVDPWSLR